MCTSTERVSTRRSYPHTRSSRRSRDTTRLRFVTRCLSSSNSRRVRVIGAVDRYHDGIEVGHEARAAVDCGLGRRELACAAAQRRADARGQFAGAEGRGDVIVGAGVEPRHPIAFAGMRRQHDDRRACGVRPRAQQSAHVEPSQGRQAQVEQDHVRRVDSNRLKGGLSAGRHVDCHLATAFERVADEFRDVGLVLDDEDARAAAGGRRGGRPGTCRP
jgi:hypothetical protein